jgi:hypothetical protein
MNDDHETIEDFDSSRIDAPTAAKAFNALLKASTSRDYISAQEMRSALRAMTRRLIAFFARATGTEATTGHAYTGRSRGHNQGGNHILVLEDYQHGRLQRSKGDALCKPADDFWRLEAQEDPGFATCQTCLDRLQRYAGEEEAQRIVYDELTEYAPLLAEAVRIQTRR